MEIIDLLTIGKELWAELDAIEPGYPTVRNGGLPDDEVAAAFLHTEFRLGVMHLTVRTDSLIEFETLRCLIAVHPNQGIWFLHASGDQNPEPELPREIEPESDAFWRSWQQIDDEFGWEAPPMSVGLVYSKLERENCWPEALDLLEDAPFSIYFADEIADLPNLLRSQPLTENDGDVFSALGALQMVGYVIPFATEAADIACSPALARRLYGTTTPERGLPMMH